MIDDAQMTLKLLGWIYCQMWQGTIYCCCLEMKGSRKNGAHKGDTPIYPRTRVSLTRACCFLHPNTFKRLLRWLCSIRTIQQRRCCRQQSTAIDNVVFLQFSTVNVLCTKSFDKNFFEIKSFWVYWHCVLIFAAWLTEVTFEFATIHEPASKLSIYGYRKDPRAGNAEWSSKKP